MVWIKIELLFFPKSRAVSRRGGPGEAHPLWNMFNKIKFQVVCRYLQSATGLSPTNATGLGPLLPHNWVYLLRFVMQCITHVTYMWKIPSLRLGGDINTTSGLKRWCQAQAQINGWVVSERHLWCWPLLSPKVLSALLKYSFNILLMFFFLIILSSSTFFLLYFWGKYCNLYSVPFILQLFFFFLAQ